VNEVILGRETTVGPTHPLAPKTMAVDIVLLPPAESQWRYGRGYV
jgi:hypothetical protein